MHSPAAAGGVTRRAWATAGLGALVVAALSGAAVPLLRRLEFRPGSPVGVMTPLELWLLLVFVQGVLAVLLGLAALAGWWTRILGVGERASQGAGAGSAPLAEGTGGAGGSVRQGGEARPRGATAGGTESAGLPEAGSGQPAGPGPVPPFQAPGAERQGGDQPAPPGGVGGGWVVRLGVCLLVLYALVWLLAG